MQAATPASTSPSREAAETQRKKYVSQRSNGATVVAIRPVAPRERGGTARERVIAIAGVTIGVSAITLSVMMILALTLEGLL